MIRLAVLAILFLVMGCQTQPTKVYESNQLNYEEQLSRLQKPIVIDSKTIVLDTRSPLDYGLSHIASSQNVHWDDFKIPGSNHAGLLDDEFKVASRLAAMGISARSQVLIVGDGVRGSGEEARIAWMLLYLGVQNVQTADIDSLKVPRTNTTAPRNQSVDRWQPQLMKGLQADKEEILQAIRGSAEKIVIIDARTEKEFFKKSKITSGYALPEINSINIDWREFFTAQGRPKLSIVKRLEAIEVSKSARIIVISNRGLRSAAATYALTLLGFKNVSSYSGGWQELIAGR